MKNPEVSFIFTDNSGITELNDQYLGRNRSTDVIAFPQDSARKPLNPQYLNLGDVAISVEKAVEQAKEYRKTFARELNLLIVHGILHLLGYDDTRPSAKRKMRRQERILLGRIKTK